MDLGLRGRVAIVTGSSKGIGKAITLGFADEGARVSISARNEKQLRDTALQVESLAGVEVLPVPADLTKKEDIARIVHETVRRFGRVDVLVNNTGGPMVAGFQETSDEDWHAAFNLLLMSVIRMCREVIPYMKERSWGRIVNMTSFAAKQPVERLVLSNALRAGVLGLSKSLSNELAPHGILVNTVCPGWTLTDRVRELAETQALSGGQTAEDVIRGWEGQIPLKRLAQPKEIADLVVFLASERASYITGAVFQVDGGYARGVI